MAARLWGLTVKNNFVVVAISYPIRVGRVVGVFENQLVAEICAHALKSLKTNVWYAGPKILFTYPYQSTLQAI